MIAHAGGFDEILIAMGALALIYLLRRPRGAPGEAPREGPCLYCGARLRTTDRRCPSCGFRAAPAPTSSATDGER